jgi:hypothetical protein
MHAQVVLREVASAAAQFVHLHERLAGVRLRLSSNNDAAAYSRPIRFDSHQFDLDPVALEC